MTYLVTSLFRHRFQETNLNFEFEMPTLTKLKSMHWICFTMASHTNSSPWQKKLSLLFSFTNQRLMCGCSIVVISRCCISNPKTGSGCFFPSCWDYMVSHNITIYMDCDQDHWSGDCHAPQKLVWSEVEVAGPALTNNSPGRWPWVFIFEDNNKFVW